ncbi:MAG: phospho-N-acetylmuramoyl-pentapeptide-transferase [Ruminococcaceae bacterium]|nr:phospho-N-acetylmuramoyl-pentapeptide-transferase [Oscillospiraceae bacterium]
MNIKALIIAFWAVLAVALLMGPVYIPLLRKLKFGQMEREDGPQSHLNKAGTPTIGGLIFITPVLIASIVLYFTGLAPKILPIAFVTVGFAAVGFLDDFLKIIRKNKDGLKPKFKMAALLLVAIVFTLYIVFFTDYGTIIHIEFFGLGTDLNLGWLYIPFTVFVLLAMTNAVNFSDGVDGLCSGCALMQFAMFSVITILEAKNISVTYFSVIFIAALLGFLFFNFYPAKVFMGDTGSLALGGAITACAIVMQRPLILLISGIIYIVENLSVIIQVAYFKKTGGKRFFRMAPIHHHFELGGWNEIKVWTVFVAFTAMCCAVAALCVLL